MPRTKLRQLRPQRLRMTRVVRQTKLRPQSRRGDASLANGTLRGPLPLLMWFNEATTQMLQQQPDLRPFTAQRTGLHQPITHSLQQGLRWQRLHQPPVFAFPLAVLEVGEHLSQVSNR